VTDAGDTVPTVELVFDTGTAVEKPIRTAWNSTKLLLESKRAEDTVRPVLLPWFALKLPPVVAPALKTKPEGVRVMRPPELWKFGADAVSVTVPLSCRAWTFKLTEVVPPGIDVVICEVGPLCPFITTLLASPLVNVKGCPLVGAGVAIETVIRACKFFPTEMLLMVKLPPVMPVTLSCNCTDAVCVGLPESVRFMVTKAEFPVGVPEITPDGDMLNPAGRLGDDQV
jgi:hypothetical protein